MEFLPQLHDFSSDLWVRAMLDDRKLSARALFDDSSHRQTQLAVRAQTGKTLCYRLPFHVYVSVGTHLPSFIHTQQDGKVTFLCLFFYIFSVFNVGHSRLHSSYQLLTVV